MCFVTPDDFSLVPPGGTVSFCKKEMVGPTVPRLEGGFPRPAPVARNIQRLEALFERSAAFGCKNKLGPRLRRGIFSAWKRFLKEARPLAAKIG